MRHEGRHNLCKNHVRIHLIGNWSLRSHRQELVKHDRLPVLGMWLERGFWGGVLDVRDGALAPDGVQLPPTLFCASRYTIVYVWEGWFPLQFLSIFWPLMKGPFSHLGGALKLVCIARSNCKVVHRHCPVEDPKKVLTVEGRKISLDDAKFVITSSLNSSIRVSLAQWTLSSVSFRSRNWRWNCTIGGRNYAPWSWMILWTSVS